MQGCYRNMTDLLPPLAHKGARPVHAMASIAALDRRDRCWRGALGGAKCKRWSPSRLFGISIIDKRWRRPGQPFVYSAIRLLFGHPALRTRRTISTWPSDRPFVLSSKALPIRTVRLSLFTRAFIRDL